jgi:hypothetical protein
MVHTVAYVAYCCIQCFSTVLSRMHALINFMVYAVCCLGECSRGHRRLLHSGSSAADWPLVLWKSPAVADPVQGGCVRAYSQRLVRAQRLADPLSQLEEDFWRLLPFEGSVPIHFVSRADGVCVAEVAWQFPGRCPSWWDKSLEQAYVAAPWHPYIPPLRFLWLG